MTMASDIYTFLSSDEKSLVLFMAPNTLIDQLLELKAELDTDNIDTNGWQVDYWIKGTYKGQKLLLSGSAWYGNAKIEKVKSFD